jgi:polysaccharide biosynthesis transport protein
MQNKSSQALTGEAGLNILPVLRRRRGLLAASALLGVLAASAYYFLMPSQYESRAEILLMQNDSGAMASGVSGGSSTSVSEELLATHMKIIQSKRVISRALESAGLTELDSLHAQLGESGSVVDYVRDHLFVTSGGGGSARDAHVLNLGFRHASREDSQKVAQALLDEYQLFIKTKFQDINLQAVQLINDARSELESEIAELDKEYAEFRLTSPLLTSGTSGQDIYTARYEELAAEASQLALQIDETQGRIHLVKDSLARVDDSVPTRGLEKLALIDEKNATRLGILVSVDRGKAETASFQAAQPERVAGANVEYSALLQVKTRLKQLLSEFGPQHPEAVVLQNQVKEMESFIAERAESLGFVEEEVQLTPDDIINAYLHMLENDHRALKQREQDIVRQMSVAEEEAKKLIALEIENEEIIRERSRREELYGSVIDRVRNLNMQSDASAIIHEILEEPQLGEKVEPNLPIALAVCLLTGLVLGGGGTLLAEFLDRSVHSPEELEKIFGKSILGHVPNFDNDATCKKALKQIRRSKSKIDPFLLTFHAPQSRISEGFRAVRTQTIFAVGGKNKVISITSANQSAGKSTLVSNLAVSLASSGLETLLIDCDMRRPRIDSIFGIEATLGLTDVIQRNADLADVVRAGPIDQLSIITTGQLPDNPAELLASEKFANWLASLREKFDYVILDCPPTLPVADPAIIAPLTDGVLFVATIDQESKPQSERASRILSSVNANILGVIVNRADEASDRYGYNSYGYENLNSSDYHTKNSPVPSLS